jgi:NADH dehydrogenase
VLLLDAGPTILPAFPEALRPRAMRDLSAIGIEIHVGTAVTNVDEHGLETNSAVPELHQIEAATKIWAAGVQASPLDRLLAEKTGAEVDRAGRVRVDPDLTILGHPELFVVGDLMSLDGLPGVAQVAIQSGQHAARIIARRVAGDTTRQPFRYRDLGTMTRSRGSVRSRRSAGSRAPASARGCSGW